ncbi:hypothetical protein CDAR_86611 [Caerostris darwini]|uniref:Transposase Tc1-like domain-containing protein n=1 Tax=Caerostris darwini TaxID=1538125 RepID=A0AAV4UHA6_9ARAC|nr:hypothetical protein CDAR_86611 [Caerostris darwini]
MMTARRELTDFERGMLVGARRMGHAISEIVREFNIPRSTVSRVCREYEISGITSHHGQRSGRPPAFNDRDRRRLQRVVNSNTQATVRQITAEINVGRTRDLSVRTVRRNLAFLGYSSRRPTRVPLLTERHRLQRLSWAREHIGWSLDEWKTVAWSNESRFQLVRADGRVRVWRRPHEAMDSNCQQGTVQAGGGSVMVWAVCFRAWTWSSGATGPNIDWKCLRSATWRSLAAIHGLHVPKQRRDFYR